MELNDKLFDLKIPDKDRDDWVFFHTIRNTAKIDAILTVLGQMVAKSEGISSQQAGEGIDRIVESRAIEMVRELIERGY